MPNTPGDLSPKDLEAICTPLKIPSAKFKIASIDRTLRGAHGYIPKKRIPTLKDYIAIVSGCEPKDQLEILQHMDELLTDHRRCTQHRLYRTFGEYVAQLTVATQKEKLTKSYLEKVTEAMFFRAYQYESYNTRRKKK